MVDEQAIMADVTDVQFAELSELGWALLNAAYLGVEDEVAHLTSLVVEQHGDRGVFISVTSWARYAVRGEQPPDLGAHFRCFEQPECIAHAPWIVALASVLTANAAAGDREECAAMWDALDQTEKAFVATVILRDAARVMRERLKNGA